MFQFLCIVPYKKHFEGRNCQKWVFIRFIGIFKLGFPQNNHLHFFHYGLYQQLFFKIWFSLRFLLGFFVNWRLSRSKLTEVLYAFVWCYGILKLIFLPKLLAVFVLNGVNRHILPCKRSSNVKICYFWFQWKVHRLNVTKFDYAHGFSWIWTAFISKTTKFTPSIRLFGIDLGMHVACIVTLWEP